MSANIAFPRSAGVGIVLAGVALLGALAVALAWQNHDALVEERDAKLAYVARSLAAGRQRPGTPAGTEAPDRNLAVKADSATLAAATMDALVRSRVAEAGGVVLSSRAETRTGENTGDPNERIEIQAVVQARTEALQAALFALETGEPLVLVDQIGIRTMEGAGEAGSDTQAPQLTATLTLSAFWNRPASRAGEQGTRLGEVGIRAVTPP